MRIEKEAKRRPVKKEPNKVYENNSMTSKVKAARTSNL